jgi:hypothetical protein
LGAYIDSYRDAADGRGAYLALTLACYDPSLAPARIETAKEHLRHLRWVTGSNLETYIHHTLEQHAILLDNQHIFDASDKAMVFRRGLSENERYRSVVITMAPDTTFEAACGLVRTAVMNDTNLNRNGRAADNRGINRAANVANAPRRNAPTARTSRTAPRAPSRRSGAGTVKGHKLPKSGVQLHNGEYSPEDIKLLCEHGEYEEMRAFRNQNNVGRSANAVATSDRQDGDAASYAEQSVHSNGTRSYLSGDAASLRSNDRGNAMVVTGRPRTVAFPASYGPPGHRNIDNRPSWMRDPQFVSEAHATKSRQNATVASLGPRWEAPTNRVIEAVARAPKATVKPLAKPRKAPEKLPASKVAPKKVPPTALKAPPPTKNLVDYSSSSDHSHDDFIQVWGRPTAPVIAATVVVAAPPVTARAVTAVATLAPTDAAMAGDAASHSTHSIFGTDSEDNDSAKGKHHVSIGDLLAKMDPKVPKTITATTRKRKAVASDLCDTDASVASGDKKPSAKGPKPLVKPRTAPTRKRKVPVPYTPIVARKSKAGNKKA